MILQRSWWWQTTLNWEMSSSPDTLKVLLAGFVLIVWSMTLESMLFGLSDLAWLSRFLKPKKNFLNHLVTVLWSPTPFFIQQMFLAPWLRIELLVLLKTLISNKHKKAQIVFEYWWSPRTLHYAFSTAIVLSTMSVNRTLGSAESLNNKL